MLQLRNSKNKPGNDFDFIERNMRLEYFLNDLIPNQFVISGYQDNPIIVWLKGGIKSKLSLIIRENKVLLLDSQMNGKIVKELDIYKIPDIEDFIKWIENTKHAILYMVRVKGTPLFHCGMSKYDGTPVFGYVPNYYRTKEFAEDLIIKFSLDYCEVV